MKVLFVSSGNSKLGISPIIKNQGESLKKEGIKLDYFTIKGKGLIGYLKNIFKLKKHLKITKYDIVHAHYSISAFVASLTSAEPLVVSLMGSDVKSEGVFKIIILLFQRIFWDKTIVKSNDMKKTLGLKFVKVIPNGVDFKKFQPIEKERALKKTKWSISKKHVLFAASSNRFEKNYKLAKNAFKLLGKDDLELHVLQDIPNNRIPFYHNSADVVLLTSLWEGSPNVIKEAMACNIPIVSTDVGDVREVIGNTKGCYITSFDPKDVAEKIKLALDFGKRTTGRERIVELGLDSENIAKKIIEIYKEVLNS